LCVAGNRGEQERKSNKEGSDSAIVGLHLRIFRQQCETRTSLGKV
jgi:hypothetical protein